MTHTTATRADVLREFQSEVRTIDVKVDAEFQRILRIARDLLEMSDQEIGDALSVSRPSVNRWINGKNLPYNAMRKPIVSWIAEQLALKIKRADVSARSYASYYSSSPVGRRAEMVAAKSR